MQVLALVGFRKLMDFFPSVFSQKDLFWLDNLMPASNKKTKDNKKTKKEKKLLKTGPTENEVDNTTFLPLDRSFRYINLKNQELVHLNGNGNV